MRHAVIAAMIIACLAVRVEAADNPGTADLLRGFSLQFGVGGFALPAPPAGSVLTSFSSNTLLTGTVHFNPISALRFGLAGTLSVSNVAAQDGSQSSFSILTSSLELDYLSYVNPGDTIKAYFSSGLFAGIGYRASEIALASPAQWNVGVKAALGVEWFFTRNLSLFAEYGAMLNYTASQVPEPSTTTTSLTPLSARLGLSVTIGS